ncbi:MAG: riboflavin synthase [Ferruginibacter sp.]|nr:riboflavin synthase [Ferruginibacter sp.]
MFTGIIEQQGAVEKITEYGSNRTFWIVSPLASSLKIDQSVSHNGVCLTVEEIEDSQYRVTAIDETLQKTNLGKWQTGTVVNLERCMMMNGRIDGHIVQGHVDAVALCTSLTEKQGSWEYRFSMDERFAGMIIEKGSITVNGISLTIFNVATDAFTVAIIPYTFEHTNMKFLKEGDEVNIEFDMIGKYVNRIFQLRS